MHIVQRPAGDDGSWTIVDFEETRLKFKLLDNQLTRVTR
jgi:hypothetical protein